MLNFFDHKFLSKKTFIRFNGLEADLTGNIPDIKIGSCLQSNLIDQNLVNLVSSYDIFFEIIVIVVFFSILI